MQILHRFVRLRALQQACFQRRKLRWAKALGRELRQMMQDNPSLRMYH